MNNNASTSTLHPLVKAAAAAVILVSGVGAAAMLGWLPSSNSTSRDAALTASVQATAAQEAAAAATPPAPPVPAPVAAAEPVNAPAAAPVREPVREPARVAVREKPAAVKHTAAKPAPAVCSTCGVITAIEAIDQRAEGSGVGAVGGALVGGLLGNQVGGGNGRKLATVAGAVGGAVAGNQIEGRVKATRSYDVTVHLDNGVVRTVHQTAQPSWREGDRVRVIDGSLRAID